MKFNFVSSVVAVFFLTVLILVPLVYASSSTWLQNTTALFGYGVENNVTVSSNAFTLSSGSISNQLAGTAINDVYVYDTTADSDAATQVTLGIDPNWRNGIVKYYGTLNTTDSANIQAGVPDNDYTNGNIIDLRFTIGGIVGTAVYEWRERTTTDYTSVSFDGTNTVTKTGAFTNSRVGDQILITGGTGITNGYVTIITVTSEDVVVIGTDIGSSVADVTATVITGTWTSGITTSTSLTELGSIGVTVSFTSGATFTANDIFQINSWYTEQLDATELGTCNIATMDRCGSREFPKKSILVATASGMYIIDIKTNTLWMKYSSNSSSALARVPIISIFVLNGNLFWSRGGSNGLGFVKYSSDRGFQVGTSSSGPLYFKGTIVSRDSQLGFFSISQYSIVNSVVNDVHAAVIGGKTYVAVATDGGVSVINETDGTVVDHSTTQKGHIFIVGNDLYYGQKGDRALYTKYNIHTVLNDFSYDGLYYNADASFSNNGPKIPCYSNLGFVTSLGISTIDGSSNTIYQGLSQCGLTVLQEKQGDETNGSVKYFTKDYITEEMIGDIRGMWTFDQAGIGNADATIANAEDVQDRSVKDEDLTVVDGGGTAPQLVDGVRGKAIQFDGSNDYLKQKIYEDQTGATFGPTYHGHSLADGSAFYRAQGVSLASYVGSTTPYMLVLKDSALKTAWGYVGVADAAEALGSELVTTNAGFETFTGTVDDGASDDFGTWTENGTDDGAGDKVEATATVQSGSYALKITKTSTNSPRVSSGYAVTAGKLYKLTFYTRGDGTNAGTFDVQDLIGGSYIWGQSVTTSVSGTSYQQVVQYFTAPLGCTSVRLRFLNGGTGSTAYFDDITLKEVIDVGTDGAHIVSTKGGSTRNWAGIESGFNYNDSAYTFEVRKTDFQITGNLTVGAWVKATNVDDGNMEFISKNGSTYSFSLHRRATEEAYSFTASQNGTTLPIAAVGNAHQDTNWHHVVATYQTSTDAKLYVDGVLESTDDTLIPSSLYDSSLGFNVSGDTDGSSLWNGTVDEPFVTAEALTAADILRMWRTGCKAMGGTPNEPGGGSPNTCDSIPGTHPTNNLAGSQNAVYGVTVDRTDEDNPYAYVATSGSGTGALSKINLVSDTLVESWTTGSGLALPSNNLSGGIALGGVGSLALGTASGFSILNSGYSTIGSLISGTSAGSGYGFDTGSAGALMGKMDTITTGSGTTTWYARGGSNETMSTGVTPWYALGTGSLADSYLPKSLDSSRFQQYQAVLEPVADGTAAPSVTETSITYDSLPLTPTNLTITSGYNTTDGYYNTLTWVSGLDGLDHGQGAGASYHGVVASEDSFKIFVDGDKDSGTLIATVTTGTTTYTHPNLTANTEYTYYIYGYDDAVVYSSASTDSQTTGVSQVLGLAQDVVNTTRNSIALTWNQVSAATGYTIYTAIQSIINHVTQAANTLVKTIASSATIQTTISGFSGASDTLYQFYVKAFTGSSESPSEGQASNTVDVHLDLTSPYAPSLEQPGSDHFINATRPTFKWKTVDDKDNHDNTSVVKSGLSKYELQVNHYEWKDNQVVESTLFTIHDIPTTHNQASNCITQGSGEGKSYLCEYDQYTLRFELTDDQDTTNDTIALTTKSTTLSQANHWQQTGQNGVSVEDDEHHGELKEGKSKWLVRAYDHAGNSATSDRIVYLDKTGINTRVNQVGGQSLSPTIYLSLVRATTNNSMDNYLCKQENVGLDSGFAKLLVAIYSYNPWIANSEALLITSSQDIELAEQTRLNKQDPFTNNHCQTSQDLLFTVPQEVGTGYRKVVISAQDKLGNLGVVSTRYLYTGASRKTADLSEEETASTLDNDDRINQTIATYYPEATGSAKQLLEDKLRDDLETLEQLPVEAQAQFLSEKKGLMAQMLNSITGSFTSLKAKLAQSSTLFVQAFTTTTDNVQEQGVSLLTSVQRFGHRLKVASSLFSATLFDTQPTTITNLQVTEAGKDYVIITWETNHYSMGKISYGSSYDYGQDVQSTEYKKQHQFKIENLTPNTTYYYEVMNQGKNYVYDARHEFKTEE